MMIRSKNSILMIVVLILAAFGAFSFLDASEVPNNLIDKITSIAKAKAEKEGVDLRKYDLVQCDHKAAKKDRAWTVFFNGKAPTKPGDHFIVWVSEDMEKTELVWGE